MHVYASVHLCVIDVVGIDKIKREEQSAIIVKRNKVGISVKEEKSGK